MPLHDYRCGKCGAWAVDVYVSIAVGATAACPLCTACDISMNWVPQVGGMDAREPSFQSTVSINGRETTVGSLHQMRQIERQTEQQARNGEGQRLVWRDYSQNSSNKDVHTLARRMDRSMDTQDTYAGGMSSVDKKKVDVARGPDVAKRQGL